ncbi:MAG: PAS domain-containing protein [Rhizomicrobium sp.]
MAMQGAPKLDVAPWRVPPPHTLEMQAAPEQSSVTAVALDALDNAATRTAANYWRMLRGSRGLPARSALSPKDMRALLRNIVLLRVIDGGADYEYRIVGDDFVWAYGLRFRGMRLTQIERADPGHGARMRELYEHVRVTAEPLGLQGWIGRDRPNSLFVYYESVLLPFADDGRTVDHVLVCAFHVPKAPE